LSQPLMALLNPLCPTALPNRKDTADGKYWNAVSKGLPEPYGTTVSILAANRKVSGKFYAANNRGIFISTDSGKSWNKLSADWPIEYTPSALVVGG